MPRIFDNIEDKLLAALQDAIGLSDRADFCVGYFNLRGWKALDSYIERWSGGDGHCCRLLVGMQRMPQEEIEALLGLMKSDDEIDQATVLRLKKQMVEKFREQLTVGAPTSEDEAGLRRLAAQIKAGKVVIKLFLRHPLHAKLYLLFRPDPINPEIGYLGSSNLTLAGLSHQGELNIDVLDHDACSKLAKWFEDRWSDRWCIDISVDLVKVVEESWAREDLIPPYHIYVKMAYHLSREAREGISEFHLPPELRTKLFPFQEAAVKIAAHHLNKRGGVLIGDVVGLGKTLMATALARIFEDYNMETLIICPPNLERMWDGYRERYHLRGKVLSLGLVGRELPDLPRYRLVVIDESHNLRNRERTRYSFIRDYIKKNDSKVIMLSATPYNKTYLDLSNQLRLFLPEDQELSIRPERLLNELGETEFIRRHQCSPRSLAAFEQSNYADDWRELMRLYLVRRTRSFIMDNYAKTDPANGRKYLPLEDGRPYYFPTRIPRTLRFTINEKNSKDYYARLYSPDVVSTINALHLPRYGLGNYIIPTPDTPPTQNEDKALKNLSRAGKRLMGFCRTNLFKRLESSGEAFVQSVERHILRNYVYLYAIENDKDLPIGTQDSGLLDARITDDDLDPSQDMFEDDLGPMPGEERSPNQQTPDDFKRRAAEVYAQYQAQGKKRFGWLRPDLFDDVLAENLRADIEALFTILAKCGKWDPQHDAKLDVLTDLLIKKHPKEKIIVFSQFADTVHYLEKQLKARGLKDLEGATGDSSDPTLLAYRFSPESNEKRNRVSPADELRVLIATDVLSEGQNLQDCAIVVNYDLPWAIIRLVQRVGRVDRIGQQAEKILCYSFLPADGVERILRLRARVHQRLQENAEVVGTDEAFFEDDRNDQAVRDLFTEKAGILDGEADTEVDLASYAYQIWKNAITADKKLEKIIPDLPPVTFSTKSHEPSMGSPEGVIVYLRTAEDNDALVWMDKTGSVVTESQKTILDAARCSADTPALPRLVNHHDLVRRGAEQILKEEKVVGGQLGRPSGARFRTYERLKQYAEEVKDTLFDRLELHRSIEEIYRYPLREAAKDVLNRLLRAHASNEDLAQKVMALRDADALSEKNKEAESREPRIICSMGLKEGK
jgi:SNF2 family DNA or RNA helicase